MQSALIIHVPHASLYIPPFAEEDYAKEKGLHEESCNPRFPIMDFYLSVCAQYPVYGVQSSGLRMIDVGKLDSLEQAEQLAQTL